MPTMIRAARLVAHGEPLQVQRVELPDPGHGQVRVEMAYAGVNPVDRYAALGRVGADMALPRTIGVEGVGRLDGRWVAVRGQGLWAEAAVVSDDEPIDVPDAVSPERAAALGVAGVTAWCTVTELAQVSAADRVLVLGAAGGVGSMVLSLVHSIGAEVWGQTGRADRAERISASGAHRAVVVPDASGLAAAAAELAPTVVFDPLGDGYTGAAIEAMAEHGRLVLFGTSADARGEVPLQTLYRKGLSVLGYGGLIADRASLRRGMRAALAAVGDGRMEVRVDAVLGLERVNEALERLARRDVDGKLVLDLAR